MRVVTGLCTRELGSPWGELRGNPGVARPPSLRGASPRAHPAVVAAPSVIPRAPAPPSFPAQAGNPVEGRGLAQGLWISAFAQ